MSKRIGLAAVLSFLLLVAVPGVASAWDDGTDPDDCYGYETWPADVDEGGSGEGGSTGEGGYVEGSEGGGLSEFDPDKTTTDDPGDGTATDGGGGDEPHCYAGGGGAGGTDGEPTSGEGTDTDGEESEGTPEEGSTEMPDPFPREEDDEVIDECEGGGGGDSGGVMPPDTAPADSGDPDDDISSSGVFVCPVYDAGPQSAPGVDAVDGVRVVGDAGVVGALPTRIDAGAGALASTGTSVLSLIAGAGAMLAGGGALLAGAGAGLRRRRRH